MQSSTRENKELAASLNISLPVTLKRFVEREAALGGYGSASELVRELIRDLMRRRTLERRLEQSLIAPADDDERRGLARRFYEAVELFDIGTRLVRARFERENPSTVSEQVEARLAQWVQHSDGDFDPQYFAPNPERLKRLRDDA